MKCDILTDQNHPSFGTRVRRFKEFGVRHLGGLKDRILQQLERGNHNIPMGKSSVRPQELVEGRWHTISGFGISKVLKHLTLGFVIPRSLISQQGDGTIE
jgi:hypothetical protein